MDHVASNDPEIPEFQMRKALVLDDEEVIAADLAGLIGEQRGWTAFSASRISDAKEILAREQISACFLDIEMPGENGLSFGRHIKSDNPEIEIVFATAFHQFAANAYRVDAADYLVKPISRDLLREAMDRIERRLEQGSSEQAALRERDSALHQLSAPEKIQFPSGGRMEFVEKNIILFAKAAGNYVEIVTTTRRHCLRGRFTDFAAILEPHGFLQIHRSYVVNPNLIRSATTTSRQISRLTLENGETLPVSENYRACVTAQFKK